MALKCILVGNIGIKRDWQGSIGMCTLTFQQDLQQELNDSIQWNEHFSGLRGCARKILVRLPNPLAIHIHKNPKEDD